MLRLLMYWFLLVTVLALNACAAHSPDYAKNKQKLTRNYEEKPLPVVETRLQFMSHADPMGIASWEFHGHWLSDRLVIVNAAQDVPNANILEAERTMLVDANTGESRQLIQSGWILWCMNSARKVGTIRPSPFKGTLPYRPGRDDFQYSWVHIDGDGTVHPIAKVEELSPVSCLPREGYPKGWSYAPLLEQHGYIQEMPARKVTPDDRAVYVPRGMPPIKLSNVYPGEVTTGTGQWLEYAQKYQLTHYDPHGVSYTEKRLAGSTWNGRPYDVTPLRLMSLDGTIEEIPYPEKIRDYGLSSLGYFVFTPVGLLITPDASLFLLQGEQLTRIWGQPSGALHTRERVLSMRISPNGCKVLFARAANWKPNTRKPIAIIHLCSQ